MKGHAVELFLDEPKASEVRALFGSNLTEIQTAPHISLAVFHDLEPSALIEYCGIFFSTIAPLTIEFSSIGMFPGEQNVVFLAPVVTAELLKIHRSFHEGLQARRIRSESHYLPGRWVPHCTISQEEQIRDTLDIVRSGIGALPAGHFQISAGHVIEFRPAVSLASFPLVGSMAAQDSGRNEIGWRPSRKSL